MVTISGRSLTAVTIVYVTDVIDEARQIVEHDTSRKSIDVTTGIVVKKDFQGNGVFGQQADVTELEG